MTVRNDEIEKILAKAERDDVWRAYLFDRLSKVKDPSKWLVRLKESGYFEPKNNPKPCIKETGYVTVPYWESTSYLIMVSEQNKLNPEKEVTSTLVNIIESLILYKDENGKRIENTTTDWALVKMIFDLPIDLIKSDYINFVKIALNSKENPILICGELSEKILPYLIENKATKILPHLLDIMLGFQINEKAYFDKFSSIIGEFYLQQMVKKHQKELFELLSVELYDILMNKLGQILSIDKKTFGKIITIEGGSQNLSESYESILIGLLRDLLATISTEKSIPIISKLIEDSEIILNRLALYTINRNYLNLKDIFWSLKENPLDKYMLKHELYNLFEEHCLEFTEEQIAKVLNWIETEDNSALKNYYKDPKQFEISEAHRKKEWLTSLLKTCNPLVMHAYGTYSEVFPEKIEHPGYIVWSSGVISSALPRANISEALKDKSNEEIVEYLKTYKKDITKDEPIISCFDELESGFLDYAKKNSDKISKAIYPFFDLSYSLQNSLLSGLTEAWKSKQKIEWGAVLKYCKAITEKETFWEGADNQRDLVVKNIAELIAVGIKDQNNTFDEKYLPVAEEVLLTLAKNDKSPFPSVMNLFTSVINSNKGAIYSAMIAYSLRYVQLKKERVWKKEMKGYFEQKITAKDGTIELYVTIGLYLPNINYLDSGWVKSNVDKIFPKDDETLWEGAMTGYAYGMNTLYVDIYNLLKNANNYSKAIETDIDDNFVTGRLMEHVCIAYINGLEDINVPGNLISQIIESPKTRNLSEIVSFVWRLRQKLSKEQKSRIIELWKRISRAMKQKEAEQEASKILASLANWITVLDDLNPDTVELLKTSAKHIGAGHELFFLIDTLLRFVETNPQEVGEVLSETITQETMLFHKVDDVQKIVTALYEKGYAEIANEICEKFWKKRQFFLQDIHEKYNKEKGK